MERAWSFFAGTGWQAEAFFFPGRTGGYSRA